MTSYIGSNLFYTEVSVPDIVDAAYLADMRRGVSAVQSKARAQPEAPDPMWAPPAYKFPTVDFEK